MANGWVPACRWQFWQARLFPAKRLDTFDTSGPISFAVSVNNARPYLTNVPNGSLPTELISGGVHCVRSTTAGSAAPAVDYLPAMRRRSPWQVQTGCVPSHRPLEAIYEPSTIGDARVNLP